MCHNADVSGHLTVAIAQARPSPHDLDASLGTVADYVARAAEEGARLVVFGETWLGGYPAWLDLCPGIGLWGDERMADAFADLRRAAVTVPGPATERLASLAAEHRIVVAIGVNERVDAGPGNRTVYNSILLFDADGELKLHHRKLVPTFTEKLVWGPGDAAGLCAVDTAAGRIGGLVCWEHWMPLPRQALHLSGETIHLALWPTVKELHQMASRCYAFEGRCFVLAAGSILRASDLPRELPTAEPLADDDLVMRGGSAVIGPDAEYVASPIYDDETLLVTDLDLSAIDRAALTLDVTGHYARDDVFNFSVRDDARRRR